MKPLAPTLRALAPGETFRCVLFGLGHVEFRRGTTHDHIIRVETAVVDDSPAPQGWLDFVLVPVAERDAAGVIAHSDGLSRRLSDVCGWLDSAIDGRDDAAGEHVDGYWYGGIDAWWTDETVPFDVAENAEDALGWQRMTDEDYAAAAAAEADAEWDAARSAISGADNEDEIRRRELLIGGWDPTP